MIVQAIFVYSAIQRERCIVILIDNDSLGQDLLPPDSLCMMLASMYMNISNVESRLV